MIVPRELLEAAVSLRASSPDLWQKYLAGLRLYAASVNADMVRCQPELLLRAQGMAMMANQLSALMQDAPIELEKSRTATNGRPQSFPNNLAGDPRAAPAPNRRG